MRQASIAHEAFSWAKARYDAAVQAALQTSRPTPAMQREIDDALRRLNAAREACQRERRGA